LKKIIYYVTDHGKGHATRSIAIIRELQKYDVEIIIRNSTLIEYFKKSLAGIKIITGKTDTGPIIQDNGISIDIARTKDVVGRWLGKIESYAEEESDTMKKIQPDLIISDISAMPILAAHKADVCSMAISNFVWSDVLCNIFSNEIDILNLAYEKANYAIQLPFSTDMNQFKNKKNVGVVCKKPTLTRDEVRKKIGIDDSDFCVFLNLGKFFNLDCKIEDGVKVLSSGAKINSKNVINLEPWIEGQNLALASDLVICKCGYGMVSECLTNGTRFQYLADENHLEQRAIINGLKQKGLENKITESHLNKIDFTKDFVLSHKKPNREKYDTNTVASFITEILK